MIGPKSKNYRIFYDVSSATFGRVSRRLIDATKSCRRKKRQKVATVDKADYRKTRITIEQHELDTNAGKQLS